MCKHRLWEVYTYIWDRLPLCFVSGHGKAQTNGKLFVLQLERKHKILSRPHWYPWYEDPCSSMLPVNNLSINTIPHESSDDQTGAIAQSIVRV
jgi:hypothetical protein